MISHVRTYADEGFVTGDSVYYRRQNCKEWHDPAKVLGKEGQSELIRHGRVFYKMHPYHLMKIHKEFKNSRNEENKISSHKINEILEEEDEGRDNKTFNSKSEELKR